MNEVMQIAIGSVFFYSFLSLVSAFYYWKFRNIQRASPTNDTYYMSKFGRYDTCKVSFFLILTISAALDVPLYIGCVSMGGPHDCEWDTLSYPIAWFLHLIAVCGYAYTIMVPCILWSDIINNKDGKLFQSQFPVDTTKRFFQVSLILYLLNTAIDLVAGAVSYRVHDHNHYTEHNLVDSILTFTEPILIFSITVGCFWCGLKLQSYVMRAKLGFKTEMRFLLHLNIPMLVIMCTYLARALLVLKLVDFLPDSYRNGLRTSYLVWMIGTRWLPYIFCSLVLVMMMRFSGQEVAARHNKNNSQIAGINSPPRRMSQKKSIKDAVLSSSKQDSKALMDGVNSSSALFKEIVGHGDDNGSVHSSKKVGKLVIPNYQDDQDDEENAGVDAFSSLTHSSLGKKIYATSFEEDTSILSQALLSEHHSVPWRSSDVHINDGMEDDDDPISSFDSISSRNFSVEYYLHHSMYINIANNMSQNSPPRYSADQTPFL